MKQTKKQQLLVALGLSMLCMTSVTATNQGDSLVTESFVNYVYKTWLSDAMATTVSQVTDEFYQEKVEELASLGQEQTVPNMKNTKNYLPLNLTAKSKVSLPQGSLFIPLTGDISLEKQGAVVNLTTGQESPGGTLLVGNQYLVVEYSTAVLRGSDTSVVQVLGNYGVEMEEPTVTPQIEFTDVSSQDWFYPAVSYVTTKGLFSGSGSELFTPYEGMTRGMMTTVLYRLAGSPQGEMDMAQASFSDVQSEDWYEPYIRWACAQNLAVGTGDQLFEPKRDVTRQEVLIMVHAFAESYLGLSMTHGATVAPFQDGDSVSFWAEEAMAWGIFHQLFQSIPDSNQYLKPKEVATRAEVATIFMNFYLNFQA